MSSGARPQEHASLAVAELHRVVDERPEHLTEAIRVGAQRHPGRHLDLHRHRKPALVTLPHHRDRGARGILQGNIRERQGQRLAVADREIDDGLDDPVEIPRGHLDVAQRVELRRVLPDAPSTSR